MFFKGQNFCSFLQLSSTHLYHIFLIHSSVDGHLGCFHILAIVNNAAVGGGGVVMVVVWSLSLACSLPGSSVHGILKAWILEWVAIPFCRVSPQPRDRTGSPALAGSFFTTWATWETCKLRRGQPNWLYFKDSCEALRDTHYHEEISWTIISSPSTPRWPLAPKTLLSTSHGQLRQFAAWLSETPEAAGQKIQVIRLNGLNPRWLGEAASFQSLLCRKRLGQGLLLLCKCLVSGNSKHLFQSTNSFLNTQ